jgi:hypothetical protein
VKIIQSFAYYDEGNSYLVRNNISNDINLTYKNYYTFLLSCLTIKKFAGPIIMFCNQEAYDLFIKYIPYDEIVIIKNNNNFKFWSLFKLDSMRLFNEDIIHVDPDVMIFNRLFDRFLFDNKIDVLVQHKHTPNMNFMLDFVKKNEQYLVENNILDNNKYDDCSHCTGVFGLRKKNRDVYFEATDIMKELFLSNKINVDCKYHEPIIVEELTSYLIANKYDLNVNEILPYDLIIKDNECIVGDVVGYTHLWLGTRFRCEIIELVKNKIKKLFPNQYYYVEKFENDVLKKR